MTIADARRGPGRGGDCAEIDTPVRVGRVRPEELTPSERASRLEAACHAQRLCFSLHCLPRQERRVRFSRRLEASGATLLALISRTEPNAQFCSRAKRRAQHSLDE